MRRNTLGHAVRYVNPSDSSETLHVERGGVYDDSPAWVAAAAADTGGQVVVVELDEMTVAELKALADEKGVEYASDVKKADLLASLQG